MIKLNFRDDPEKEYVFYYDGFKLVVRNEGFCLWDKDSRRWLLDASCLFDTEENDMHLNIDKNMNHFVTREPDIPDTLAFELKYDNIDKSKASNKE